MNHEHYVLCKASGEVIAIFVDWERAEKHKEPGDYLLTKKDPALSATLLRELGTLGNSTPRATRDPGGRWV